MDLQYSTQQAARLICHSFHSSHKYYDGLHGLGYEVDV